MYLNILGVSSMPDNLNQILSNMPSWAGGTFMAIFVSLLKSIYKGEKSLWKIITKALLCGCMAFGSYHFFDPSWHMGIGVMIGVLGPDSIEGILNKLLNKKVK